MKPGGPLARRYAEHRFTALLATLLLAIGGHGLVGRLLPIANPLEWLLGLSLVAVILSVRRGWLRWTLLGLVGGLVGARLTQPLLDHPAPTLLSQSLAGLACLLAAGVSVRRALASGPVDAEHISAALDAYLLVGIAFGVGYWLLETMLPGSIASASGAPLTPQRIIYFSFVTQATVGYGDIVPVGESTQGVAILQGVGGQLYLVVLVARLVSLYSTRHE
jgi:hypothetical protein